MLYLVISKPQPSRPDDVKAIRRQFRSWIGLQQSKGKVLHFYPKVGRGAVVIFDLASNDELHDCLTQWMNMIPADFDIHPLANPAMAEAVLE